jgi:hypothetical protein
MILSAVMQNNFHVAGSKKWQGTPEEPDRWLSLTIGQLNVNLTH